MNLELDLLNRVKTFLDWNGNKGELRQDIGTFLGEPVDDGKTLTIKAMPAEMDAWEDPDIPCPKGLTSTIHTDDDGESFTLWKLPEAGTPRYFDRTEGGIVVPINGQRYRVFFDGSVVTFERTEDPESEFSTWDALEDLVHRTDEKERDLAHHEASYEEGGRCFRDEEQRELEWLVRFSRNSLFELRSMLKEYDETGEVGYTAPFSVTVFGQPQFLQNDVFPVYKDQCAMNLMTLETGDGNMNLLFACDSEGIPCRVWVERS